MRLYVAICEERSFAGAARRLGLHASVLTRAVASLEGRLGTLLLARNTRSLRMTDAGRRFFHDCRHLLQDLQDAADHAAGPEQPPRGLLTITAPVLFGERFVTPIVLEFLRCYPQVQVRTLFLDRVVHLQDERVDVAVRLAPLNGQHALAEPVGQVQRVVCGAPSLLASVGRPRTPAELARFRLIDASATGAWEFQAEGHAFALRPDSPLCVNANRAAIAAAVDGFGLTRVMNYQVAEELADGRLEALLQAFQPAATPIHVICPAGRQPSQRTLRFVELCCARLRANPALH